MIRTHIISKEKIPQVNYDGYLWYSNKSFPLRIQGKLESNMFSEMPFIIEGNLWSEELQISINIKNIDGVYHIVSFNLDGLKYKDEFQSYLSQKVEGVYKYKMYFHWEERLNSCCLNMKEMKFVWSAFIGFHPSIINKS